MSSYDDSSSYEERDLDDDEDIALVLMLHKNKRPKHSGSVLGCEMLCRLSQETDSKLSRN